MSLIRLIFKKCFINNLRMLISVMQIAKWRCSCGHESIVPASWTIIKCPKCNDVESNLLYVSRYESATTGLFYFSEIYGLSIDERSAYYDLFEMARRKVRGKSHYELELATLLLFMRCGLSRPISYKHFFEVFCSEVHRPPIGTAQSFIRRVLRLTRTLRMHDIYPKVCFPKAEDFLKLWKERITGEVYEDALRIIKKAKRKMGTVSDVTLCASVLYIANKINNIDAKQKHLAEEFRITETSLRNCYKQIVRLLREDDEYKDRVWIFDVT